jgi:hypothetical protein
MWENGRANIDLDEPIQKIEKEIKKIDEIL